MLSLIMQIVPQTDLSLHFTSLAAVAAATIALTQMIKTIIAFPQDWMKQLLSWVVAIVLSFAGYFLQLGIFAGLDILWTAIYGVAAGLVANGLFTAPTIEAILSVFKKK